MILLSFAWTLNLVFEAHSIMWLHEAFVASGISDPGAFLVRNALESKSEILIRLPLAALVLSTAAAFANAWMTPRSKIVLLLFTWIMLLVFVAGAIFL